MGKKLDITETAVRGALEDANGHRLTAAKALGISPATIHRRIAEFNIDAKAIKRTSASLEPLTTLESLEDPVEKLANTAARAIYSPNDKRDPASMVDKVYLVIGESRAGLQNKRVRVMSDPKCWDLGAVCVHEILPNGRLAQDHYYMPMDMLAYVDPQP